MKRTTWIVLMLFAVIFFTNPLTGDARGPGGPGGPGGGPGPGPGPGCCGPVPFIGEIALWAPLYPPFYPPPYYYPPPYPVVIQEQVTVATQGTSSTAGSASEGKIFVYPRQGQSEAQQATDRYECHRWAVGQTAFDPTQPPEKIPEAQVIQKRSEYYRALGACLDGRGYTMR